MRTMLQRLLANRHLIDNTRVLIEGSAKQPVVTDNNNNNKDDATETTFTDETQSQFSMDLTSDDRSLALSDVPVAALGCLKCTSQEASVRNLYHCSEESLKKTVSFSNVEIYNHEITLGDHPSVSSGPPLTIKWRAFSTDIVPIASYEAHRPRRRSHDELFIPRMQREDSLIRLGFARSQLAQAANEARKIQESREKRFAKELARHQARARRSSFKGASNNCCKRLGKAPTA